MQDTFMRDQFGVRLTKYNVFNVVRKQPHEGATWIPIAYRIKFKLCTVMHGAVFGRDPSYIQDLLPVSEYQRPHTNILGCHPFREEQCSCSLFADMRQLTRSFIKDIFYESILTAIVCFIFKILPFLM